MNDLRVYLICEVAPWSLNALLTNAIITSNFAYNISGFFFIFMLCLCIWHLSIQSYWFILFVSFPQSNTGKKKNKNLKQYQKGNFLQLSHLMTFIVSTFLWLFSPLLSEQKCITVTCEVIQIFLNSSAIARCESNK